MRCLFDCSFSDRLSNSASCRVTALPANSLKETFFLSGMDSKIGITEERLSPDSITKPVVRPAPMRESVQVGTKQMAGMV